MADFNISRNFTIDLEGGFWNDPSAGYTYRGITKKYFPFWPGFARLEFLKNKYYPSRNIPRYTVFKDSVLDEYVSDFYKSTFWNKIISGDLIKNLDVANLIYDFCVHKQYDAVKVINDTAELFIDDIKTHKTNLSQDVLSVINNNYKEFYKALKSARINYYKNSNHFSKKAKLSFIKRVNAFPDSITGINTRLSLIPILLLLGFGFALSNKNH